MSVYDNFINSIQLRDGRYCVKLPWKDPYCTLPSNYDLCQKRLHGLLRRLKQDTRLLKEYDGVIREQLTKGIVEKVALVADIEKAFLMITVDEEDRDVLRHHIQGYQTDDPSFVTRFLNSIYVDDLTFSIDEAFELYTKSKHRLAEAGFNLRKLSSNSMDLLERISQKEQHRSEVLLKSEGNTFQEEDQSNARHAVGANRFQPLDGQRVLGLHWDPGSDQSIFDVSQVGIDANLEPKKRDVVSLASRIYDPMGILSPVTIQFKILYQKICELKIGWDNYVSCRRSSEKMEVLEDKTDVVYSLQGFSDASQEAYAAVIYLKVATSNGVQVRFVASKTRVAPANGMTIPRLELHVLAALLLSKLMMSVSCALEPELTLDDPSCFTDSKVTLYWIQGQTKEWKQFVQNRVRDIRRLLPIHVWKHCSGRENPADIPSRGMDLAELANNPLWLNVRKWLCNSGEEKSQVDEDSVPEGCLNEMKAGSRQSMQSTHNLISSEHDPGGPIMECKNFSTLRRLMRITAHIFKVIEVLKAKIGKEARDVEVLNITATDMAKSELYWIKIVQHSLESNARFITWKQKFKMFTDESGLWRSRYWIVRGRSFIRRILHECLVCKKMQGQHYIIPSSPPLPEFRVQQAQPFSSCGVDYAGPLFLNKRFTARRGVPCRVISDNSKTCKSASRLIFKLLESSEVRKYFGNMHLTWDYNLEKAPWWGRITHTQFTTTDYVSSDDLEKPITPSHLLIGYRLLSQPELHDADHSRVLWKTGIVEKLITGRDGVTRGAVVRLSSAKGPVTLRRPLQLLYPLEMSAQGQASNVVTDNVTEPLDAEDSSME
eukprot:Em0025g49a